MTEAEILRDILRAVGSRDDCRLWRSNTGTAQSRDGSRFVRFGLKGTSDLLGILRLEHAAARAALERSAALASFAAEDLAVVRAALRPVGQLLAIETKSERGRLSTEQATFRRVVQDFGGLYVLARSEADAVNAVEEAACR